MTESKKALQKAAIQESAGDRIFNIVNMGLLVLIFLVILYPLIYVLSSSFSSVRAVTTGQVWLWPVEPTLIGYETVFQNSEIVNGYRNTIFLTVGGTLVNIVLTIMLAYPLSVKTFYGRNLFMGLISFTMLFNGGLIPTFLLINKLGMYDSYWALILPAATSAYNVIVARSYFSSSIPADLYEAAELDGCSDIGYMLRIAIPLAKPIIAVLVMFYAVGHWNSFFNAMIYLSSKEKYTLQIILRNILIQNQTTDTMFYNIETMLKQQGIIHLLKYCLIVVSSVPMLVIYPFIQKFFVKGVMIGAIKG